MNVFKLSGTAALLVSCGIVLTPAMAYDFSGPGYLAYDGGLTFDTSDIFGPALPLIGGFSRNNPSINLGFVGISQIDVRSLHGNLSAIPPDTNGAIGNSQFMEVTNGAYAVYDKTTGNRTKLWADGAFWNQAGQSTVYTQNFANGDSRVLYDKPSNRWIVESFGASLDRIQIAVSDTSDATGTWKSTSFQGFNDPNGYGIADYPTLAIDSKAIYIGTNNFTPAAGGCPEGGGFCGTTLNVISRNDIFGAGGPTATSLKQFTTPYSNLSPDNGYSIQGVNQVSGTDSGRIIAIGAKNYGMVSYQVNNPGAANATTTASVLLNTTPYDPNRGAAQPDGSRTIDTSDDRISSATWEVNGHIYAIHTITRPGEQHTSLEYYVIDAATNTVIQTNIIGDGTHDFFQGTLAVNESGQVVISYNRSGFGVGEKVAIYGQQFNPIDSTGALVAVGDPILLYTSLIDNYHNGSVAGAAPVGRQRWGDYAQVTVDPNDPQAFWIIGQYALGYLPNAATSFSRWGTFISSIQVSAVPEPSSYAMLIVGLAVVGITLRRRQNP